jgi:hypothetical protein
LGVPTDHPESPKMTFTVTVPPGTTSCSTTRLALVASSPLMLGGWSLAPPGARIVALCSPGRSPSLTTYVKRIRHELHAGNKAELPRRAIELRYVEEGR